VPDRTARGSIPGTPVAADRAGSDASPVLQRVRIAIQNFVQARPEWVAVSVLVAILLLIGLATVGDYGVSWDEPDIYAYGDYALGAYRFFLHPQNLPLFHNQEILNLYGPAYFMAAALFARLVQAVHPAASGFVAWHLFYFLTFVVCSVFLYLLARRSLGVLPSVAACLIFVTQPLFWGHAFINPKDLPFMAFFLASVYLGLEMVDRYLAPHPNYVLAAVAAVVLGLTISIRSIAPLAGLLVCIYALSKSPRRALRLLLLYGVVAVVVAYMTWPFLWGSPIQGFLRSLETMSQYPFARKPLFMGRYYASNELPWFYYPVLLGIQLTVPVLLLALVGVGAAAWRLVRRSSSLQEPLWLFVSWFLLPVIAIAALRSPLYDNGRQLFFLLPPLFLAAGLGFDLVLRLVRPRWLQASILLLCLAPALYASIRLHPYEYVYYNDLVGGTGGAYRQYEMEYWATSYRELGAWLNEHAPAHSTIWAGGPTRILRLYLRPDLVITCSEETDCDLHYDYIVILSRWKADATCPHAGIGFSVGRRGVVFAVVKHLDPGRRCK
jgi:4-amino-4-deoxy-L-arabinose transferase-like glycosyltransferase